MTTTGPATYRLTIPGEDIPADSIWIRTDRSGPWDIKVRRVLADGTLGESRWVMRGNISPIG